jgi:hypothetical protein
MGVNRVAAEEAPAVDAGAKGVAAANNAFAVTISGSAGSMEKPPKTVNEIPLERKPGVCFFEWPGCKVIEKCPLDAMQLERIDWSADGKRVEPDAGDLDLTAGWGHAGKEGVQPGENVWVNVDVLMTHDVCGPGTIGVFEKEFGKNAKVWDPDKIVVVQTAPSIRAAVGEGFGYEPGTPTTGKLVTACRLMGSSGSCGFIRQR